MSWGHGLVFDAEGATGCLSADGQAVEDQGRPPRPRSFVCGGAGAVEDRAIVNWGAWSSTPPPGAHHLDNYFM